MKSDAWNPQQYDKFKDERSQPFYDLMKLVQPKKQAEAVDLGCGTGELTAVLHEHLQARKTTGLDSSEEMLKKAQVFAKKDLVFFNQDISTFQSPKSFDLVFSNAALQWCPDHPALFQKLTSTLRPGGQIAIQMPMNHDYPTHVLAQEMSLEEPWVGLLAGENAEKQRVMLSVEEYATLLFRLGFKEQKVLLKVYGHLLEDRSAVLEWVKGTLLTRFQSRLPSKDYQDFLVEFQRRLFERLPDENPFFYPFKRILLWGRLEDR